MILWYIDALQGVMGHGNPSVYYLITGASGQGKFFSERLHERGQRAVQATSATKGKRLGRLCGPVVLRPAGRVGFGQVGP